MRATDDSITFAAQLALIVNSANQPTLRELYSSGSPEGDIGFLFKPGRVLTSKKSIVVYGDNQYFGDAHADLVIEYILGKTPSAYMNMVEPLRLHRCGFVVHELYNDGHVCKYPDRHSYLDCAHSIGRKVLETALALVASDGSHFQPGEQDERVEGAFSAFAASECGISRLDRSLGEVASGPLREGLHRNVRIGDASAWDRRHHDAFPSQGDARRAPAGTPSEASRVWRTAAAPCTRRSARPVSGAAAAPSGVG